MIRNRISSHANKESGNLHLEDEENDHDLKKRRVNVLCRFQNTKRFPTGVVIILFLILTWFFLMIKKDAMLRPEPTEGKSICYYDGHCPVRSFCVPISNSSVGYGMCMPFSEEPSNMDVESTCYDTCLQELQLDEHFYYESWPLVTSSSSVPASSQRPKGCILTYHRETEGPLGKHWQALVDMDNKVEKSANVPPPSVQEWVKTRFRHIKRVDPAQDGHNWMAFCTAPCASNATCHTVGNAFYCDSGACIRNNEYWKESLNDMVLVTAATRTYYKGLTNLCASARYWAPRNRVVVYNLGDLEEEQIQTIESWSNVLRVEWRDGVPDHYPEHVKIGKQYAWKPLIINETVHKYKSILWLDAGNTLTAPIDPAIHITRQNGIMLFKGQDDDMKKQTSSKSFEWFGYDKETMKTGPSFAGGMHGYLYPSRYVSSVVRRNAACALEPECFSPSGSSLSTHRYDQSTLSILAYALLLPHFTEYIASRTTQLSQDPLQPSFRFLWTSRQSNDYFTMHDSETGPLEMARREKVLKPQREHQKALARRKKLAKAN